ncbi:MAG: tripartite tricarboxylate transporter TctB family protein [Pseudomonadota bacterium]
MIETVGRFTFVVLVIFAALMFASTFSSEYDVPSFGGDVSTVFVPRIYLVILLLLSVLALCTKDTTPPSEVETRASDRRLITVVAIAAATGFAMLYVGFVIATIPGFFLFCFAFGYRKLAWLVLFSILAPLVVWFLFNDLLELPLPRSPWFTVI